MVTVSHFHFIAAVKVHGDIVETEHRLECLGCHACVHKQHACDSVVVAWVVRDGRGDI